MENSMSRILIETIIKRTLRNIKDNPERGIRNLIDMALQFWKGGFRKIFLLLPRPCFKTKTALIMIWCGMW